MIPLASITRAREHLVMTHARTRRVWGEVRFQAPSRFLDDLPVGSLAAPRSSTLGGRITPPAPRIVDGNWSGRERKVRPAQRRDEFDQRVEYDEPVYRVDSGGDFIVGAAVTHEVLGTGRVVAISNSGGAGKQQLVVVDFGEIGRKTVQAKFLRPSTDGLN